jgi:hypothetical protein
MRKRKIKIKPLVLNTVPGSFASPNRKFTDSKKIVLPQLSISHLQQLAIIHGIFLVLVVDSVK